MMTMSLAYIYSVYQQITIMFFFQVRNVLQIPSKRSPPEICERHVMWSEERSHSNIGKLKTRKDKSSLLSLV